MSEIDSDTCNILWGAEFETNICHQCYLYNLPIDLSDEIYPKSLWGMIWIFLHDLLMVYPLEKGIFDILHFYIIFPAERPIWFLPSHAYHCTATWLNPGNHLSIKTLSNQYRKSCYKDKLLSYLSCLYINPVPGQTNLALLHSRMLHR